MKIRGLRWWIVALLFGAALLNYVDRQTLSALAPTIQHDLEMDDREYANVVNIGSLVIDLVPKHSLGTVFSVVAAGSTLGGIFMNLIVATMVSGPSTKAAGFLDVAVRSVAGPVLQFVQGHGYGQWFLVMAFLHPVAWIILKLGRVSQIPSPQR